VALDRLFAEGLEAVFARHHRLAEGVRRAVTAWGLSPCATDPALYSDTVTAVQVSAAVDARDVLRIAYEDYATSFGGGLGPLMGRAFRIGHLGDLNEGMVLTALSVAELALARAGEPVQLGSGVAAAQTWFVESALTRPAAMAAA
jgi:Serine-pyruvate aminotransferase/archaeal aspartate aminotransferase